MMIEDADTFDNLLSAASASPTASNLPPSLRSTPLSRSRSDTVSSNLTADSTSTSPGSLFEASSSRDYYTRPSFHNPRFGSDSGEITKDNNFAAAGGSGYSTPSSSFTTSYFKTSPSKSPLSAKGKGRAIEDDEVAEMEEEGSNSVTGNSEDIGEDVIKALDYVDTTGASIQSEHDSVEDYFPPQQSAYRNEDADTEILQQPVIQVSDASTLEGPSVSTFTPLPPISHSGPSSPALRTVEPPSSSPLARLRRFSFSKSRSLLYSSHPGSSTSLSTFSEERLTRTRNSSTSSLSGSFLSRTRPSRNLSDGSLNFGTNLTGGSSDQLEVPPSPTPSKASWKSKSKEQLIKVLKPQAQRVPYDQLHSTKLVFIPSCIQGRSNTNTPPVASLTFQGSPFPSLEPPASHFPQSRHRSLSAPLLHIHISSPLATHPLTPYTTAPSTPKHEAPPALRLDLFDFLLPREIRVRIFRELVDSCILDVEIFEQKGKYCGEMACERWQGEARGRRDLIRLGRVSRSWLSLSLDGQLWNEIDIRLLGANCLKPAGLIRLLAHAGAFVKMLRLEGMTDLKDMHLLSVLHSCTESRQMGLTDLNLRGCTSLSQLILCSFFSTPNSLTSVNLSALLSMSGSVLCLLGKSSPLLQSLNVNQCLNLEADDLVYLPLSLRILRISRISHLNDATLLQVSLQLPNLEVLDMSYATTVTDSAFLSIVTPSLISPYCTTSELPSTSPPSLRKKNILPWRHLNLSGCPLITGTTLIHLSHAVPSLEFLELARVGRRLGTGSHFLKFFRTVPLLRKLDLEDGTDLTDQMLLAMIPKQISMGLSGITKGGLPRLETLILNSCVALTDSGILSLVRGSEKLRELEVDGTRVEEGTCKEFVMKVREADRIQTDELELGLEIGEISTIPYVPPPALLSLLDDRTISKRLYTSLSYPNLVRPRQGMRGHWTRGIYHDDPEDNLKECREGVMVVRSFWSSCEIDKADLRRINRREGRGGKKKRTGGGVGSACSVM